MDTRAQANSSFCIIIAVMWLVFNRICARPFKKEEEQDRETSKENEMKIK
jgi:hypothetical protein